jgi:homocysteine S-methyltransferase
MTRYRNHLPQLGGELFLTDAGLETDLIFNHGIEIPELAAHTLLADAGGRQAVADYMRGFLALARDHKTGFVLDTQTWKAHPHWAGELGSTEAQLKQANRDSVAFVAGLREEFSGNHGPVVLNGVIGPRGDAYAPEKQISVAEAESYHLTQLAWLAETEVDMVTALTFTQSGEAAGFARAARTAGLPCAISFTLDTDGRLPTGQPLTEAIHFVDSQSDRTPAYYMINCAHPDHFADVLEDDAWARRIRGIRCNASRRSHAELDECETLDDGDPHELATLNMQILARMPWVNVLGGCCGSDLRHITEIADALAGQLPFAEQAPRRSVLFHSQPSGV